jgi:hypothetical protein
MIVQRFERGNKFLDLCRWEAKGIDEDGVAVYDSCWECVIYENEYDDYDKHKHVEFDNEVLAKMFISTNGWKEQVL